MKYISFLTNITLSVLAFLAPVVANASTEDGYFVPLWGQAYSPSVGWINMMCENGATRPSGISVGEVEVEVGCSITESDGFISYGVEYNPLTNAFKGTAYSPNAGWLSFEELSMQVLTEEEVIYMASDASHPIHSVLVNEEDEIWYFTDPHTISVQENYGTLYTMPGNPNEFMDGVFFNASSSVVGGVAYTDYLGWVYMNGDGSTNERPIPHEIYLDIQGPVLISAPENITPAEGQVLTFSFADNSEALIDNSTSILWGQAYSANAGYINFYCDSGSARPTGKTVGAATAFGCDEEGSDYYVEYNEVDGTLVGYAYSSNYGWLQLGVTDSSGVHSGASIVAAGDTADTLIGTTTFGNFGTTDFGTDGTDVKPGVTYDRSTGMLCGQAWSDVVGVISFCSDETDSSGYGVYIDEEGRIPIESIELTITDPENVSTTFTNTQQESIVVVYDLEKAGEYDVTYVACDTFGNCTEETINDFFAAPAPGVIDEDPEVVSTTSDAGSNGGGSSGTTSTTSHTQQSASTYCATNSGNGFIELITSNDGGVTSQYIDSASAQIADGVLEKKVTVVVWLESTDDTGATQCYQATHTNLSPLTVRYTYKDTTTENHFKEVEHNWVTDDQGVPTYTGSAMIFQNGTRASTSLYEGEHIVDASFLEEGDDLFASFRVSAHTPTFGGSSFVDEDIRFTLTGFTFDIGCSDTSVCEENTATEENLDYPLSFSPQVSADIVSTGSIIIGEDTTFSVSIDNSSGTEEINSGILAGTVHTFENTALKESIVWDDATKTGFGGVLPLSVDEQDSPRFTDSGFAITVPAGSIGQSLGEFTSTPTIQIQEGDAAAATEGGDLSAYIELAISYDNYAYPIGLAEEDAKNTSSVDIIGAATSGSTSVRSRSDMGQMSLSFLDSSSMATIMKKAVTPVINQAVLSGSVCLSYANEMTVYSQSAPTSSVMNSLCQPVAEKELYVVFGDVSIDEKIEVDEPTTVVVIGGNVKVKENIEGRCPVWPSSTSHG